MFVDVQCPFCFEAFAVTVHPEDGEEQSFVYDCEVCCRPIDMVASCNADSDEDDGYSCQISTEKSSGMD